MAKNNKRPQAPKARNESYMRGMQELRRSNAAGSHKSIKDYQRKSRNFKGWEYE